MSYFISNTDIVSDGSPPSIIKKGTKFIFINNDPIFPNGYYQCVDKRYLTFSKNWMEEHNKLFDKTE